jgi:dipeptidyl aminopeptidase/acylaminoacyl peptidase
MTGDLIVQNDARADPLYLEAEVLHTKLRQPGTGQISDATEVHVAPDGRYAVFAGTIVDKFNGSPPTRVCRIDLSSADIRIMTFGQNTDRLPKYSPDGRRVAFLSDRHEKGDFQLYLLNLITGAAQPAPFTEGWVEYLHWSPDGHRILLGVAGHGSDVAGVQGAIATKQIDSADLPSWMPKIEAGERDYQWRRAYVYDCTTHSVRQVSDAGRNIWEAVWCGSDAIAAVASPGPSEGLWYSAQLEVLELETRKHRTLYKPQDQLGWPVSSPSGRQMAIVEAVCSDRCSVAGELRLLDVLSGQVQKTNTNGVDITYAEWRSDRELLVAGHRGLETVVGVYDVGSRAFAEIWSSGDLTAGGYQATLSGLGASGDCVMIAEGFGRAPEIALIRRGVYQALRSFDLGSRTYAEHIKSIERLHWPAPDGVEIQGWLLRPQGEGPFPLIMVVHGGPVSHWRPRWLGRAHAHLLLLLKRGYALFLPNPRGSSGRGQDFARRVVGDMGGADTYDYLSGLDNLIKSGIGDPSRLGVTGQSYGGFMSAWLITQDPRFAAAVAIAPVTNWVTEHLISNISNWVGTFLSDKYINSVGKYSQRSPIMHAHKTRTPTLIICGALDRCTPATEAVQFHRALQENGVRSMLVTYPDEGHGVRKWPATIDYAARIVGWFQEHIPTTRVTSKTFLNDSGVN